MEKKIKMVGTRVLVDIYEQNPYEMNETENGFKLTNGEFDNPDSGDRDTKNPGIVCGKIVEFGSECKYVSENCDAFLAITALRPISINDKTYYTTFEENILVVFE